MKVEIQKQLIIEMWNALSIIERIYFLSDNFLYDQLESEFISKFKFENLNTQIQNKIFNKIIQKSK
jgi:uncharacterized protein (DUF2249 family)